MDMDARVTRIEQEDRMALKATQWGITLIYEDTQKIKEELSEFRIETNNRLDRMEADVSELKTDMHEVKGQLASLGTQMAEVLAALRAQS